MSLLSRRQLLSAVGTIGLGGAATACGGSASHTSQTGSSAVRRKSSGVTRVVEAYGSDPLQVGEWFAPAGSGPAPTVLLVHGGFWSPQYDRSLEVPVALDLAARGYLCWNIDYRASDVAWPATLVDVANGYDHLYQGHFADRIDPKRVAVVGHSAGGQLVAWLASRHRLPHDAPGYNPEAKAPALAIPQAGVVTLTIAAEQSLGGGAAQALLDGSPKQVPERYQQADPLDLLPSGVRSVVITDANDTIVPPSESKTYVARAKQAGDDSTLVLTPGNHFSHIDPKSVACQRMRDALATMTA